MKKALLILLCIVTMAANTRGSGNVEISDGKLKIFSEDAALEMHIYREETDAYIDWDTGTLYLEGNDIGFDNQSRGNSKFFWDDANQTLIVYIIDANYFEANDVNAITGTFSGLVAIDTLNLTNPLGLAYGGTGSSLSDPDDDRIFFWDDSATASDWLDLADELSISAGKVMSVDHDLCTNFVANEHIDHTAVSISAGTGLTGGGDISANRTISMSHLGLESLSDPGADRILCWDDSATASDWLDLADELSISAGKVMSVDHDLCTNFLANEHIDWTNATQNFDTTGNATVDGSLYLHYSSTIEFQGTSSLESISNAYDGLTINADDQLRLHSSLVGVLVSGDSDDYVKFQTVSDVPEITTVGTCELKLSNSLSSPKSVTVSEAATAYDHSQIAGGDSVHVSTTENTNWDTAYTHSGDSSQAHSDYLTNNAADTMDVSGDARLTIHSNTDSPTANAKLLVLQKGVDGVGGISEIFSVDEDGDVVISSPGILTIGDETTSAGNVEALIDAGFQSTAGNFSMLNFVGYSDNTSVTGQTFNGLFLQIEQGGEPTVIPGGNARGVQLQFIGSGDDGQVVNAGTYNWIGYHIQFNAADAVDKPTGGTFNMYGLNVGAEPANYDGATLGFRQINLADAGSGYALYSAGGQSVHAGNVMVGSTTAPTETLEVDGTVALKGKSELTIATGSITTTKAYHTVDTESDDATDDLNTIAAGSDGEIVVLRPVHDARTVVVKNGADNIVCGKTGGDVTLDDETDTFMAIYDTDLSKWLEL